MHHFAWKKISYRSFYFRLRFCVIKNNLHRTLRECSLKVLWRFLVIKKNLPWRLLHVYTIPNFIGLVSNKDLPGFINTRSTPLQHYFLFTSDIAYQHHVTDSVACKNELDCALDLDLCDRRFLPFFFSLSCVMGISLFFGALYSLCVYNTQVVPQNPNPLFSTLPMPPLWDRGTCLTGCPQQHNIQPSPPLLTTDWSAYLTLWLLRTISQHLPATPLFFYQIHLIGNPSLNQLDRSALYFSCFLYQEMLNPILAHTAHL